MNYDKIGKFIQEKRKKMNLTQKGLAKKIGVTDKAISKWERGQGCPDVSILEILSKELGCSILELLKGREIENKVISVTEVDDYVKEGIKFSKNNLLNKFKIILNRGIELLIIIITLWLGYLNIVQIIYIDKEYNYSVNKYRRKEFLSYIDCVSKNMEIIKNDKGKFEDDDYQLIVENISNYYEDINKIKLFKYIKDNKELTFNVNDLRLLNMGGYYIGYEYKTLDILSKYVDNNGINRYKELMINDRIYNEHLSRYVTIEPYFTYKYRLPNSDDPGDELFSYQLDDLSYIEYDLKNELCRLIYLMELIMEVGDIHE